MKEKIISKKDFITYKWSGGETVQLAIYPEDANFKNKDFSWKISSANFTSTQSKFCDFTGYQRYILPIEGSLTLQHERLYNRELNKYEVEYFDGSWSTFSKNSIDCRNYNFMVKNGSLANMQILKEGHDYLMKESEMVSLFSTDDFLISLKDQDGSEREKSIHGFSLLVLETEKDEEIKIKILKAPLEIIVTKFVKV